MSLQRDRMSRDMQRAGLAPATRRNYILAIRQLAEFFHRPPDQLNMDDLRTWDDHLTERGDSANYIGVQIAALRFFYGKTLGRPEVVAFLSNRKRRRKLPTVLCPEEVSQILEAIQKLRYRTLFALLYDTGLRIDEALRMKVGDIDRARGVIRVPYGKGGKPRQVKLGDRLYELLKTYWREVRQQDPHAPSPSRETLLFVNLRGDPGNANTIRRVLNLAMRRTGITKPVTPHTFRHTYATLQLEAGTDLRVLQAQLGHADISTTQIYLQVSTRLIRQTPSPLDTLPPP
jgi:integrase/recombinase XerD